MDIHKHEGEHPLEALPSCCEESAGSLEAVRAIFEQDGVFPVRMVDGIIRSLRSFHDKGLLQAAIGDPERVRSLVDEYFYCG